MQFLEKVKSLLATMWTHFAAFTAFAWARLSSVIWGAGLGAVAALCFRLFQAGIFAKQFPQATKRIEEIGMSLDSDQVIRNSFSVLLVAVILLLLPNLTRLLPLFRSWRTGLVSFLSALAFVASLASILFASSIVISISCGLIALLLVVEFTLRHELKSKSSLDLDIEENKWSRLFGPTGTEPISTFQEDLADRKAVVSTLSRLVMQRQEPIITLNGAWGTGKSSVLRLLQIELGDKAIVVQFNAWLPGTEVTFAKQLMGAIASECGKHYAVPGLERSLKAFAQLVAGSVKQLEALKSFFPADSQQVEMEHLISGINRVPKRVVVLIDEIDRMDAAEASVLLKVLRGAPAISNITFVCAVNVQALEKKLRFKKHELEKFMPLMVRLQPPDTSILRDGLKRQFEKLVQSTHWAQTRPNGVSLSTHVSGMFEKSLSHQFSNFRTLRSLVGLYGQIERTILSEVNPLDMLLLVAIELRAPQVLDFIARHSDFLVDHSFGSSNWGPTFDREKTDALDKLSSLVEAEKSPEIFQILCELFPIFDEHCTKGNKGSFVVYRDQDASALRDDRRVAVSDFAWAYFRGFLAEETLSQAAFGSFVASLNNASSFAALAQEFRSFAQSIESELMLKDFWWRLARVKTFPQPFHSWTLLVRAIAQTSDLYSKDELGLSHQSGMGIGHFCVTAFWNALENVPIEKAQTLLSEVILEAPKDAFALQLTKDVQAKYLFDDVQVNRQLNETLVRQAFLDRMNKRYGDPVPSLTSPDSYVALVEWSNHSESNKQACREYFRSRLDRFPSELPQMIGTVYPLVRWNGDARDYVEAIFPLRDLETFIVNFPLDGLDAHAASEIARIKDLLAGNYPTN